MDRIAYTSAENVQTMNSVITLRAPASMAAKRDGQGYFVMNVSLTLLFI